ncbi:transmembrane protein [Cryptosporidium ryanae]|uniref:uncharacterized protein n=1 Tax=Cryptosporidium ryanae TaxID=515981 RepID=UPI00351A6BCB|nr:transmembrane protein [Cryptosporidium ryanae]
MNHSYSRALKICAFIGATGVGIYFGWRLVNCSKSLNKQAVVHKRKKDTDGKECSNCNCNNSLKFISMDEGKKKLNDSGIVVKSHNIKREIKETQIPGIAKIMIKNFGCNHNRSDSESMAGILSEYGYTIVKDLDLCDLIVINSCTVKGPSQDSCRNTIELAKSKGKYVIVTGCVPQADIDLEFLKDVSILGVKYIHRIVEVVELTLQGNLVSLIPEKEGKKLGYNVDPLEIALPPLMLPKVRKNPYVEIITVSVGCLGNCTYCKTKQSRGELGSYPIEAILERVRESLKDGIKQFWLTSEDIGAYGKDIDTNLSVLLKEILKILPQDTMLRIGMTNPPYILDQVDEIIEILKHPNVFEFLHIPVQSGSNKVLNSMRRDYSIEDFCLLVDSIIKSIPLATIATDIICGFPGENENDHLETVKLIKKYRFPVINISKFYPRPGTPAAKMKPVQNGVSKNRSLEVTNIFKSFNHNKYIFDNLPQDKTIRVWFVENSEKSDHTIGHTKHYNKVLVTRNDDLLGKSAKVRITGARKWHLEGVVIGS